MSRWSTGWKARETRLTSEIQLPLLDRIEGGGDGLDELGGELHGRRSSWSVCVSESDIRVFATRLSRWCLDAPVQHSPNTRWHCRPPASFLLLATPALRHWILSSLSTYIRHHEDSTPKTQSVSSLAPVLRGQSLLIHVCLSGILTAMRPIPSSPSSPSAHAP